LGEEPEKSREGPPEVREFRSAHRGGDGCEPAFRPIGDCGQHRLERRSTRCQPIADPHRWTWVDKPLNDAFGFKLAQTLGQNAITDSRYAGEQLVEASRPWKQRFDHSSSPALADQLYRSLKGCTVVEPPSDHGE
jgi:hypothetical protein